MHYKVYSLFSSMFPKGQPLVNLLHLLQRIDMIGAQLTHTVERAVAIRFLGSFMDEQSGIMTARPVRRGGLFLMFKPFTINAWLMCIGSVILSALLSHAVHCYYLRSTGHQQQPACPNTARQVSLSENMWSYIRSFLAQGTRVSW